MVLFTFSIIFLVLAAITFAISFAVPKVAKDTYHDDYRPRRYVRIGGLAVFGFAVLFIFLSMIQTVSTKNVGVKTAFGKPTGHLSNGFHLIAPWEKVTEFPAAIQTDSYVGDANKDNVGCTNVRIANQSVACVDNSVRWRINPTHVAELYQDYKNFDHVRDSLVSRELRAALNDVFSSYDPLKTLVDQSGLDGTATTAPSLDVLAQKVTDNLRGRVGDQVEVLNVIIPLVHHDQSTQDKINQYQAALADTRIAIQRQQIATAEAKANQILSDSIKNDPNVLVSKCLDMIAKGFQPPTGFQCWYGASSLPLTIPATESK